MNSESRAAWGSVGIFLIMAALFVLALSGFGWAGYSFTIALYYYFVSCLIQRKISFSKSVRVPSVSLLILKGTRAVVTSILFIAALTIILLLAKTNIMELIIIPNQIFQSKINISHALIGLPIGLVVGYFYIKISTSWEQISVDKYNSQVFGN